MCKDRELLDYLLADLKNFYLFKGKNITRKNLKHQLKPRKRKDNAY